MASTIVRSELRRAAQESGVQVTCGIAESSARSTAILYARRSRTPDGPASTLRMAKVSRLSDDPQCYWQPPRRRLPSRGVLVCRRYFRIFRQVADTSLPRTEGG